MEVRVKVQAAGAKRLLTGMKARARDLRPAWSEIAERLQRSFMRQFQRGGDPTWQPLTPSTIKRRRRGPGAGSPKVLRDTGLLMRSWGGGPGKIKEAKPHELTVGTRVSYAAAHQFGRGVPIRAIHILDRDKAEAGRVIRKYIMG